MNSGSGIEDVVSFDIVKTVNQSNWIASVCSYFHDFLDTDFKRSSLPKRSVTSRDQSGILTGMSLLKYPELSRDIVEFNIRKG